MPLKKLVVNIEPVQSGTGNPSPENVRPITGWTGCNVIQGQIPTDLDWTPKKTINASGIAVTNDNGAYSGFIPVQIGNNLLAFNSIEADGRIVRIHGYTADGQWVSQLTSQYFESDIPIGLRVMPFDIPDNGITQIRLSTGNIVSFVLLDVGKHIPITFPVEAGTVYAGTLDVMNGALKARPYYASYNGETLVGPWVSSMDVYAPGTTPTIGAQVVDLGGVETVYQLTPPEITTLLGTNNIWADCGPVSVDYPADTKLYIDALTAPTEDDMIANARIESGKYFMVGNMLYLSTALILAGETIIPGTNCQKTNLAAALNALNT
jgi:hypothetical protein